MEKLVVTFRCDVDMERRIRIEAAKKDMNRTEFIIEALKEKLERISLDRVDTPPDVL